MFFTPMIFYALTATLNGKPYYSNSLYDAKKCINQAEQQWRSFYFYRSTTNPDGKSKFVVSCNSLNDAGHSKFYVICTEYLKCKNCYGDNCAYQN